MRDADGRRSRFRRTRVGVQHAPHGTRQTECGDRANHSRKGHCKARGPSGSVVLSPERRRGGRHARGARGWRPRRNRRRCPGGPVSAALPSYGDALLALALEDERIVVMTAENRAPIRTLPAALGARFIDTGITEQTMVGMAAGLALRGRIPVVHALATFLTMRAFEFIRTDVGIPSLPVKLVGTVPGILSEANGPTHQALEDVAIMRGIPRMRVFWPADRDDLVAGLAAVIHDPAPWYIRHCDRTPAEGVEHASFEIGHAEVFAATPDDDVAILVAGALFSEAWEAAALLREEG